MTGRDEQRADRLKAALRDNLRRRKAQSRERGDRGDTVQARARADAAIAEPEPGPPPKAPATEP